MTRRPVRLVALRALKLGDFLTGIPALRALARAFPGHERILVAPALFAPFLPQTGMHRICDSHDLLPLDRSLRGADVAVDLHGRGPESQRLLLDLEPARLVSFAHPDLPATAGSPVWRAGEHEVRRWCRMLGESGIPADPDDLHIDPAPFGGSPAPGCTIVHPGAASEARRWPASRFAAVARHETAAGRRVLVTGGARETDLAARVATLAGLPTAAVAAGRTDLGALTALVAHAGRVVCGDTGVAHLATAVGTPSVVLFGPVPPHEWGPPPGRRHVAVWAGRRGDPHGGTVDAGLLDITTEQVVAALGRLDGRTGPVRGEARQAPGGAAPATSRQASRSVE